MIKLNAVSFAYTDSDECLKDISLHVRAGECVVLTGRSGSGKTTITRIINGLAPTYYEGKAQGEVFIDGKDAANIAQWEKGKLVGSVFQDPSSQFFSGELVGELAFACENYGFPAEVIRERVDKTIEDMALSRLSGQGPDTLSSGEKQKVAIASVRAASPTVYVFDEPSANLDEQTAFGLAEIMRRLKREGHTLIVSEHRLSYLMDVADRFIYMENGCIIKSLTPSELMTLDEKSLVEMGLRRPYRVSRPPLSAPPEANDAALALCGISYRAAGKEILSSVSLAASKGQCVAITGQNGAGKTTLSQIICGQIHESGGELRIHGKRVPPRKRSSHVWYSANDTNTQFFTPSVEEELLLGCDKSEKTLERARDLLKRLELYQYKSRHPVTLSGGQKQRLSIACGLFSDRDVLIFDEPTSGLDGDNLRIISDMLREAAREGKTVLVVTHDNELICGCCTHLVCL